jgi:Bifunctional DNA primase/polymerase, N-terminal
MNSPVTGPGSGRNAPGSSTSDARTAVPATGGALRQAAHFYLGHGLLPVPAWGAGPGGSCRCPRGAGCPRPGKHPRSVHAGPGDHDYSWKPLTCRTHGEVEERFAGDGPYARANLMLAIPAGLLVIDIDDDDGGRDAIAGLENRLGDLPATLTHQTPHGVHRIYQTPPGWTCRAWVGKHAGNPLPAGIDLRVPGQILMAPPSQVPSAGRLARYGPVTDAPVAGLPGAYVAAWTPPQAQSSRPHQPVPVPPGQSGTAARFLHAKITGILADLAGESAGRNAGLYTAALKIGSALGAARATPGAEQAAAGWTDQAAEDALLDAAGANGYLAKDGPAAARTAIRSGLRNGLRDPRPLPDFTRQASTRPAPRREGQPARATARWPAQAARQPSATPDNSPARTRPDAAPDLDIHVHAEPGQQVTVSRSDAGATLPRAAPPGGPQPPGHAGPRPCPEADLNSRTTAAPAPDRTANTEREAAG